MTKTKVGLCLAVLGLLQTVAYADDVAVVAVPDLGTTLSMMGIGLAGLWLLAHTFRSRRP